MSSTKTVELDSRFKFGPPPIQTAEDAVQAFLRGEITQAELDVALGKYGAIGGQFGNAVERIDAAFEHKLPDELVVVPTRAFDDLEVRQAAVAEKNKARDAAAKKAAKEESK